jgi:prephenate dehydrogenase
MKKQKIAVVGMGQFGTFLAGHLAKYHTVVPIRRDSDPILLANCTVVVFAVTFDGLLPTIENLKKHIPSGALILDVMSIKQKPLSLLKRAFPKHEIIGTHPVFGPQSGKDGIAGMPVSLCNVSAHADTYGKVKKFLTQKLKVKVLEQTPKEHDHQMAQVQALTHFIGRALLSMNIESYTTNSKSYAQLLELCGLIKEDTWGLFATIQNHNPEAKKVRTKFLKHLQVLEKKLALTK